MLRKVLNYGVHCYFTMILYFRLAGFKFSYLQNVLNEGITIVECIFPHAICGLYAPYMVNWFLYNPWKFTLSLLLWSNLEDVKCGCLDEKCVFVFRVFYSYYKGTER